MEGGDGEGHESDGEDWEQQPSPGQAPNTPRLPESVPQQEGEKLQTKHIS